MATLTIELRRNPETRKQDIVVHLESDADALPHEHEEAHRTLVEKLIGRDNVGRVIVERAAQPVAPVPVSSSEPPARTATGQSG
jgi:hypothetical protein